LGVDALTVAGATSIDLKDGTNSINAYLPRATFAKNVTLLGGTGADTFQMNGGRLSVTGAFVVNAGDGANDTNLGAAITTFSGGLTILGGNGADIASVYSSILTVPKAALIDVGDGANIVSIGGGVNTFGSTVMIKGGAGSDFAQLNGTRFTATGAVSIEGGAGQDQVQLYSQVLALKAGLSITGGDDADTVNFFADGSIVGDLSIDLGASADGDQSISIGGNSGLPGILKVGGALTLKSQATDGGMGYTDLLFASDISVTKDVLIGMGDANSSVYVDNVSTGGNFTLQTGGGADDVGIDAGSNFGSMTIAKVALIQLGGGSDTIRIGGSSMPGSHSLVKFLGNVTVDGEGGTNFSNDFLNPDTNIFAPGVIKSRLNFDPVFI
jgi:hypothetical protein